MSQGTCLTQLLTISSFIIFDDHNSRSSSSLSKLPTSGDHLVIRDTVQVTIMRWYARIQPHEYCSRHMHETIRCSYEALQQVEKVSSVFKGGRIFENDLHRVFARNGATGRAGARTPLGKSRQSLFSRHLSFSVSLILSLVIDSFLFFVSFFL